MSQSSTSTESRKRKDTGGDFATSGESLQSYGTKRRRTRLSLKRNSVQGTSSFNSTQEDEDSQSCATLSFSNATVSEKNEPQKDYKLYASKYGIQLKTAKKYYEILSIESRVIVIRAEPIKRELSPILFNESIRQSPIFGSKRKLRKPKIKQEIITPTKKDLDQRASEKIEKYFKSLPFGKVKEEVLPFSESENQTFDCSTEFQNLSPTNNRTDQINADSSDEFMKISKSKNKKKFVKSEKSESLVANPFSKTKSRNSSKNCLEMRTFRNKKSLSTNEVTNKVRKRKNKVTEILENGKSKASPIDDLFNDDKIILPKRKIREKIKLNEAKNNTEVDLTKVKIENETTESVKRDNSLSVNYQSLFGISNIEVKKASCTTTSADYCEESPVSFGAKATNETKDINVDQPTSFAGNKVHSDKENGNALNDSLVSRNTDDESQNLNSSFVSLDICGSPMKLDVKSPISRRNPITVTPESKCSNGTPEKPKAKPKIISNELISKPGLSLNQKRLQLKTRPNSPITCNKPSKLEKLSLIAVKNSSNGVATETISADGNQSKDTNVMKKESSSNLPLHSGKSPQDGQSLKSVPVAKLNSNKTLPHNGGKQQKNKQAQQGLNDETFEGLCQDVCNLSNNENITLYKGEQNEDDYSKSNQNFFSFKRSFSRSEKGFDLPVLFVDEPTKVETPATSGPKKISPIRFQSSPGLKFRLKQNTDIRSSRPVSGTVTLSEQKQQQQQQNEAKTSNISIGSSVLEVRNRDIRFNRSFSPNSNVNIKDARLNGSFSSLDPRLNRSPSPSKPLVTKDPRLLRGNSQPRTSIHSSITSIESPEKHDSSLEIIIDPRLRKRKEREEAEQAAKMVKEGEETNGSYNFISPQNCQFTTRKSTVFNRLGVRTGSPEKEVIQTIVKDARSESPTKSIISDNEDNISLFAADTFSSDEESNSSPRHRKFISERLRANEEIRNTQVPLKDRLGWSDPTQFVKPALRKATMPTPVFNQASRPATRMPINTGRDLRSSIQSVKASMSQAGPQQINPMSAVAKSSTKITFNEFGNNNPEFNDNFYKMNAAQMLKDVDNLSSLQDSESTAYVTFGDNNVTQFDYKSILDGPSVPPVNKVLEQNQAKHFFTRYCYKMLKSNNCSQQTNDRCHFVHKINVLKMLIGNKSEKDIIQILDYSFHMNFDYFISYVWQTILPTLQDSAFSIFQKLYNRQNVMIESFLLKLLDYCHTSKLHSVESFVKRISPIVKEGDVEMVSRICVAIKSKLKDGFCWEAIKDLCQKAVPPRDMIDLILKQCLERKKNKTHIMEVNDLITRKLTATDRERLSSDKLTKFNNLVRNLNGLPIDKELLSTIPLMNVPVINPNVDQQISSRGSPSISASALRNVSTDIVQSLEQENIAPSTSGTPGATFKRKINLSSINPIRTETVSVSQPINSPLGPGINTPNRGETTDLEDYNIKEFVTEEPRSIYKDRFWKLYCTLNCVNAGLDHVDYSYVWKVMDDFSKIEEINSNEPHEMALRHAYFNLLCKNVRYSEKHVSEIIKQAVRSRSASLPFDVLFDVGVSALIDLANNDLWVMALQLLGSVKILEPDEPKTAFVLISAEIYLANNDPLEALYLLQKTRLIRTNNDEWLVKDSTAFDVKHRNKIVFILLKALSFTDPEKAMYLFKALLADQYIAYYPIDLPLYVDKFSLLLLIQKNEELVAEICRLVMDNDLTFKKETYQELLRHMLGYDEVLADQILDYAIHLGYYNDIQIKEGYTAVLIDINFCEEELYLIFKRLIRKLVLNIGPALDHLKPTKLKVFLIFEDVPDDKRLYRNDGAEVTFDKYRLIKKLVSSILATRFSPPIKLVNRSMQKFCKIVSRSLVDYLKHWS